MSLRLVPTDTTERLIEITPLEITISAEELGITISDEEILADLLYPAPADGSAAPRS
jgi:hypothetical protein